jgi:tRNA threonylcarbamoyladenosine biosynthesis protein TsaE
MKKTFIYVKESLEDFVKTLIFQYPLNKKWAWYGQMGSGKTTLTKSFIRQLGSVDPGSSPTFSIANTYLTSTGESIAHLDLYRLHSEQEAFNAGIYELLQEPGYCFVEWPERIENWLDEEWVTARIRVLDGDGRLVEVFS